MRLLPRGFCTERREKRNNLPPVGGPDSIATWRGFSYAAFVIDVFVRCIVR
jgi:hypothetical protein